MTQITQIPAASYSTIFHCTQSGFVCILRLLEGLVSVGMFIMFYQGYKVITRQRNNKLTAQDKLLYQLAMWLTLMIAVYYLVFEEFFMLATVRNFLIWIGVNVLQIFGLLYWHQEQSQAWINRTMYCLQFVNLLLWLFISLGQGSSLDNADYPLGYNCQVMDWMLMSAILLIVNMLSAALGYFKINQIDWQVQQLKQQPNNNDRRIESSMRQKYNIMIIMGSGLIGSSIMFGWDYLAYNNSHDKATCEMMFSGNTIFRNILCFLLKIFTMQLNPSAVYYVMYYCRKDEFNKNQDDKQEMLMNIFDDGASYCNQTNRSLSVLNHQQIRQSSNVYKNPADSSRAISNYS